MEFPFVSLDQYDMAGTAFTQHLRPPHPQLLSIRKFNICNGPGFGRTQAIRSAQIGGFNIIILTDTKITDQAYWHSRLSYNVVCLSEITTDYSGVQGRVVLVIRDLPKGWSVDSTHFHRPNVLVCEVVSGVKHTSLIGEYLPPSF